MKSYRIQKHKERVPVTILEVRGTLYPPKLPRKFIKKVHKLSKNIEFVFRN